MERVAVKIDVVTIFPRMVEAGLADGVVGRARNAGLLDIAVHDLRDFTTDRHTCGRRAVRRRAGHGDEARAVVCGAGGDSRAARARRTRWCCCRRPGGAFTQDGARRLAALGHLVVLCGRYEGIDERVREPLATEEVSIGDYVLSGGELPALVVIDAVARLVPGVVGDEQSVEADSFTRGLLDYPHYTRPAEFAGGTVPEVLVSGHHGEIRRWRRERRCGGRRAAAGPAGDGGARRRRTRMVVEGARAEGRQGVDDCDGVGGEGAVDRAAADEGRATRCACTCASRKATRSASRSSRAW